MASFVREVLSAAGTLGENEDFAGKTSKIQKKLHDLKSQLAVHINNRYVNYSTNLSNTTNLSAQMERLAAEIVSLDSTINKHFRRELMDQNQEVIQLNEAMNELNLTLQIVRKIKQCYNLMEESNGHLSSGKWFAASKCMQSVVSSLVTPCSRLDETDIKIMPALRKEMVAQNYKLSLKLKQEWNSSVSLLVKQDLKGGETTSSLVLRGGAEGTRFRETVSELVQSLHSTQTLEEVLQPFNNHLKNDLIRKIVTGPVSVEQSDQKFSIVYKLRDVGRPDPLQVLATLRVLFTFLAENLSIPLAPEEREETLLQRIGGKLGGWFCQTVIEDVLAPAVPSSVERLPEYEDILTATECFHEYVVETGFLPSSNLSLPNYARNVDALFANNLCQDLLVKAREIMKEDLFTTELIETGASDPQNPLNQKPETADLPIPPNFTMPEKSFQFPSCRVSCSTLRVLELAVKGLEEAVLAQQFCSVRLFNTVRNIFELWCAVVPTFHKSNLESLPQLAAIAHNSAMYLAHRLLTLGFLYKERLPALSLHTPTFIDLVPRLRQVGGEMMLKSLRIQRDTIVSTLSSAGMNSAGSERRVSSGVDQAVRQFLHQLSHLHKVWEPVLPADIYFRCMGTLINAGVEEIIQRILSLSDISADMSQQYSSLFNQIVEKAPELLDPECPEKHVKKWEKFRELIVVLNSSLRTIEDRWGEGTGGLAKEFTGEEVKQLIRAIFQNTERRAAVLSKIK